MKLLKSRKLTKSNCPLFSVFSFVTPRLASYFGKGLNVFIVFAAVFSIVFWCPVKSNAVLLGTSTISGTTFTNLKAYNQYFSLVNNNGTFVYASEPSEVNRVFYFFPSYFKPSGSSNGFSFATGNVNIDESTYWHVNCAVTLFSDVAYRSSNESEVKYVIAHVRYQIPFTNISPSMANMYHIYINRVFGYTSDDGSTYSYLGGGSLSLSSQNYNSSGHFDYLGASFEKNYSKINYSSQYRIANNTVFFDHYLPLCELSLFNAYFDEVESFGMDFSTDIESEDSCNCNCVCDCDCGYYSEELKEELIDYFETNMVTREMFEEFVENNYNYYESQQEEISSIKDNTEFSSQVDDYYDNADNMFSDINNALDGLDDFESHLTLGSEIQGAGTIINSMFSNFPPSIIVAMVFVLVMLVVVKIIGR